MSLEDDILAILRPVCSPDEWARVTELHDTGTIRELVDDRLRSRIRIPRTDEELESGDPNVRMFGESFNEFCTSVAYKICDRARVPYPKVSDE